MEKRLKERYYKHLSVAEIAAWLCEDFRRSLSSQEIYKKLQQMKFRGKIN